MTGFNYPNDITKDTPAIAAEVQGNFDAVLQFILNEMVQRDGTVTMTAPLNLFAAPTVANHAANKAYVDGIMPVGTILEYAGTVLPSTQWLWCNGDVYVTADKPKLSAAIGRSFTGESVPQGSFQVPDKRGRVSMGAGTLDGNVLPDRVLGTKGGKADSELLQHTHIQEAHTHVQAAHGHVQNAHNHGQNAHAHGQTGHVHNVPVGMVYGAQGQTNFGFGLVSGGQGPTANISQASDNVSGTIQNTTATNQNTTAVNQNTGAGTTLVDKNLPPYLVTNFIIYAGE